MSIYVHCFEKKNEKRREIRFFHRGGIKLMSAFSFELLAWQIPQTRRSRPATPLNKVGK